MLNLLSPTSSITTNLYNMIWTLYQSDYEYEYHKLGKLSEILAAGNRVVDDQNSEHALNNSHRPDSYQ